ncbi:MAG: TIGR01777 family protein [Candidatus Eremiobacter antarcticus]|nr:TIGR01777 family protein [Candidatus Eremiobacteraeota bacterium]MBC5807501.1 TIGR01777 family protein [Candidatus Eremiobacteraeota bacterium]PZR61444.1 MAG: TIGR01777 family protein [Candidatus Eremiobacter sp. RRmetagenome_bin22]
MTKRVGITGATGFIGRAMVDALAKRGDQVRALVRNLDAASFRPGVEVRRFDVMQPQDDSAALEGLDAIVHLAGESVAGRWTAEKKRQIRDSRVVGTRNLVGAMRACVNPPRILISASASGYYGGRRDEVLEESAAPGDDFLAGVCIEWEREAHAAAGSGSRVVCVRQGLVLGPGGGALHSMLPPFRLCIGGPLGSGRQWWPWIHLDDDVALYLFALDREDIAGALNAVSPDITTNARFSQALGHAMRRPSLAPAPPIALRAVLGEFSETLLSSQLMLPAKAEDARFVWKHESLEQALIDILSPGSRRRPALRRLEASERVDAGIEDVFAFFSDASNLQQLTPPSLDFVMLTPGPIAMRRGAVIEYQLKVHGLPIRWKTLITKWRPGECFEDVQLRGPYSLWKHRHEFEAENGAVVVRDRVEYALPLAPLSNAALPLVDRDVKDIFAFRRSRMQALLRVNR